MSVEAPEAPAVVDETIQPPETPESPVPEASPAAVAETVTAPATTASARARGPDGRFIKADGTQASETEQAAMEAEVSVSPPDAATTTPSPPVAAPAPPEPFTFRAAGQRIPIPGSSLSPEGHLTIQAESVPNIRQLLAEGMEYRQTWRTKTQDYERRIQEAGSVQEARATKYSEAAIWLWQLMANPDWLKAAAEDPREVEYTRRELQLMLQSADLKAPKAVEAPRADPAAQQQQLEAAAKSALDEEIDDLLDTPTAKQVYGSPADVQAAKARFARRLAAYCVEVDGQVMIDRHALQEDFNEEVKLRTHAKSEATKLAEAAARNAVTQAPKPIVPSVVPAKGSPTPGEIVAKPDKLKWAQQHGLA